jgi:hypothetical protein
MRWFSLWNWGGAFVKKNTRSSERERIPWDAPGITQGCIIGNPLTPVLTNTDDMRLFKEMEKTFLFRGSAS